MVSRFYWLYSFFFQDSKKMFQSLVSLVIHHSVMPECLPCPLVLNLGESSSHEQFSKSCQILLHGNSHNNRDHDFADTDLADYSNLVMTLRKSISSSTSDISLTSVDWDNSIWKTMPLCKVPSQITFWNIWLFYFFKKPLHFIHFDRLLRSFRILYYFMWKSRKNSLRSAFY